MLESSSDGHITWGAELCQQCPQEGLLNNTGFNKGQMTALNGRPQRKMRSTKKKGHRARIDGSDMKVMHNTLHFARLPGFC